MPERARALDSPMTRRVWAFVDAHPGVTMSAAREALGMGWGTFYHHLQKLLRVGVIQAAKFGRRRLLYSRSTENLRPSIAWSDVVYGDSARRIAQAIASQPGMSILELSERLGETPRVVYYHVRRMSLHGLVTSSSPTRYRHLSPTPVLLEWLATWNRPSREGEDRASATGTPEVGE